MPIRIGATAPRTQVPAYVSGRRNARLAGPFDERGRWVVLAFYPRDFSSECADYLADLAEFEPAFAVEDTVVMAASTGSWLSHRRWFQHHPQLAAVTYPVLADAAGELSRAFGTLRLNGECRRTTFIIDPEGIVRHAGGDGDEAFDTLCALHDVRTPNWPALLAA
jgi:peroxiredoxin (alkyl hydroperoxide reductase subunit C)